MLGLKDTQDVNGITRYYITNTGNLTIDVDIDMPMKSEYCMEVCYNTTLTITGKFSYVEFVLQPQSTIKFPYNGTDYSFTNQDIQNLYIPDIVLLVETCKFLDTVFPDIKVDSEIDKIKAKHFADYNDMDKDLINLFAQQNNMNLELSKVDEFILKYSSELSAVAESLSKLWSNKFEDGSDLASFSSQELSDVNPSMDDQAISLSGTNKEDSE
ncbi:MAG: hypothetical protein LN569_01885 [Rickettsia endosymbiont of Labidopullus appendiculatus]|nr:hypothetical protein [Rickettsia endosymbiont of Labidopullus appendiculatus]